jgi:signal peptidase I
MTAPWPQCPQWFTSRAWRAARAARKRQRQLLAERRDELPPAARAAVQTALDALSAAMAEGHAGRLRLKMEELQLAVNEQIPPYPHPVWRANVELVLVALAMVLGLGAFFVQPFKIPTGSMQPTLFGVASANLLQRKSPPVPTGLARVREWLAGVSYVHARAPADGLVERVGPVWRVLALNLRQSFWIGGVEQVVWFPPDVGGRRHGIAPLIWHPGQQPGHFYHQGEDVINLRRQNGDYVLADRLTYNFRPPARGEIIIFKTQGIPADMRERFNIPVGEYYIKRLVGLPGERVQIGNDRHVIINGRRLDATTPHFGGVYGFDPAQPPEAGQYSGHLNGTMMKQYGLTADPPVWFPDPDTVYTNGPDRYLMMGDNTEDSLDSRYWGALAGDAIIGKGCFVIWPLSGRFGWGP